MRAIRLVIPLLVLRAAAFGGVEEGVQLFHEGRYAEAERELQTSTDPRGAVFHGLALAATNRCDEALGKLRDGFEENLLVDVSRLAGLGLARCAVAGQRELEAVTVLYELRARHPEDPDVLYELARAHNKAWNGVVEDLYDAAPASFRVHQLSAEIFEIQQQFSEAVAEYKKAIDKAPNVLNLHYRMGRALLLESHEPEALSAAKAAFEAELDLNPRDAVAHYQIAQILSVQQDAAGARRRLARAAELDPSFVAALVALGRLESQSDDHDAAIARLRSATELEPENESAHYALMLAYRNAGRRDEARAQQRVINDLNRAPEGEFSEFLRRIGEPAP